MSGSILVELLRDGDVVPLVKLHRLARVALVVVVANRRADAQCLLALRNIY